MKLRSQEVRALAPENDPLKIGMGWSADDLSKPQILIESTFGDSHPDDDEFLEPERLPLEEAVRRVMDGELDDAKTQIAVLKIWERKRQGKL